MSHSPGPWEWTPTNSISYAVVSPVDDEQPHFTVICSGPDDTTENANARLIAAAPDLLSILKDIERELGTLEIDWKDGPTTLGEIARAAIAKATGA